MAISDYWLAAKELPSSFKEFREAVSDHRRNRENMDAVPLYRNTETVPNNTVWEYTQARAAERLAAAKATPMDWKEIGEPPTKAMANNPQPYTVFLDEIQRAAAAKATPLSEPLARAMADRPSAETKAANEVMRRVMADPDYGKSPPLSQAKRDAARASRPAAAPESAQSRQSGMEAQQSRALER